MLTGYDTFLRALHEHGFLPLGGALPIVTLESLTQAQSWHQDDKERDPWAWRMRVCAQKDGAYARILFGKPTLIAPDWYGVFLRAFERMDSLEERYACGECDPLARRIWALFETRPVWARHELLTVLGRREIKASHFDRALGLLEREMRITINAEAFKIAHNGMPYGWPSVEYARVDVFAPQSWRVCPLTRAQAREKIAQKAMETSPGLDARALSRMLGA